MKSYYNLINPDGLKKIVNDDTELLAYKSFNERILYCRRFKPLAVDDLLFLYRMVVLYF